MTSADLINLIQLQYTVLVKFSAATSLCFRQWQLQTQLLIQLSRYQWHTQVALSPW